MKLPNSFLEGPIAHRTLHDISAGRPENSWEGLEASLALGVAIEIDVQLSKDGVPVVFHDYELQRLTGLEGLISETPSHELKEMVLLNGEQGIPMFDDFMKYVSGRIPVLIELKDQDGQLGPKTSLMEPAVCDVIRNYSGDVALMSFNPHMIARCAMLAPNVPHGIVTDKYLKASWPDVPLDRRVHLRKILDYETLGASFISHDCDDLESAHVARIKKLGANILCWTVKSKKQEDLARIYADTITFEGYLPKGIG